MTIKEYETYAKAAYSTLIRTGKIPPILFSSPQHCWKDNSIHYSKDDETSFSIKELIRIINNETTRV